MTFLDLHEIQGEENTLHKSPEFNLNWSKRKEGNTNVAEEMNELFYLLVLQFWLPFYAGSCC